MGCWLLTESSLQPSPGCHMHQPHTLAWSSFMVPLSFPEGFCAPAPPLPAADPSPPRAHLIAHPAASQRGPRCFSCRLTAKAVAVLLPILGTSWAFGVLAVNDQALVFQYMFAVLNSLQVSPAPSTHPLSPGAVS